MTPFVPAQSSLLKSDVTLPVSDPFCPLVAFDLTEFRLALRASAAFARLASLRRRLLFLLECLDIVCRCSS